MIFAAGILILNKNGEVLFLKRGPGSDYPGTWCFPGGGLENGEDAITAAVRECKEETGHDIDPKSLTAWTRRIAPSLGEGGQPVDFVTFLAKVEQTFIPDIKTSGEHVAWQWSAIGELPQPIHPGCMIALARFDMDELGVARAMAAGELTSPQVYGNISLFDLRISGTGYAARGAQTDAKGKITREAELTYRRPENYLTQDFLDRCNGLPVILLHPDGASSILDSAEFSKRIIGTILLPYIKGDEAWGIGKIYNAEAAQVLATSQLSTSPGVLLGKDNHHLRLEDGSKFLIEGKPSLVDHLAICPQGVWDKGGDPTGVLTTGDLDMKVNLKRLDGESDAAYQVRVDEVTRMVELGRNDSGGDKTASEKLLEGLGSKLDQIGGRIETLTGRMDAADKARTDADDDKVRADAKGRADAFKFPGRKDGEDDKAYCDRMDAAEKELSSDLEKSGEAKEVAADRAKRARKDSEKVETQQRVDADDPDKDKDKDKDRNDAVKVLTEANAALTKRLDDLAGTIPKPLTDADYAAFSGVQARADAVCSMFGQSAGRPQQGESVDAYRVRLLNGLKGHTKWADIDLNLARIDGAQLTLAETQILEQAAMAARNPAKVPDGVLIEVPGKTGAGANKMEFMGQPRSWMSAFMPTGQFVQRINANPNVRH